MQEQAILFPGAVGGCGSSTRHSSSGEVSTLQLFQPADPVRLMFPRGRMSDLTRV